MMVNNSTNQQTNKYLSPQAIEHKKTQHMVLEIQVLASNWHKTAGDQEAFQKGVVTRYFYPLTIVISTS
jgi:hypothetical protein